ncbi:hypothetical protein AO501_25090 [Mycobacterium gordonae]|uniref:Uncharacterized protein n=1 Tax=Mycobacterium gordonae TaxID=1778 RepID=A0A0Q2Q6E3_MYCGO|nr:MULTISPECIES: hypothetical protein [Mycobacterium]KQH75557.1 hypothetical protein AO501_25090 [Mycobacterium gordonae]MDP7732130.1 hypothetical protein [Mycobacterium sp. TY813]
MSIFSTLRALADLACDIGPALRRFAAPVPDDADPYSERLARAHAELPGADCGLGEADECLCDPGGGLSCDTCSSIADIGAEALTEQLGVESIFRSGGQTSEMGPRPKLSVARPPSAADEPAFIAWLASVDARLAAIQNHLTSAAPGATFTPDAAPESPAPPVPEAGAGQPGLPWCAAEMRQVADILATTDSPFALGYANDLRAAAATHSATLGQDPASVHDRTMRQRHNEGRGQ